MGNINIILGENIRQFRKKMKMTQEELADKLGVSFQAVSKWENAQSAPDISLLPAIAAFYAVTILVIISMKE